MGDLTVTPQPAANEQPGAVSLMVQSVCPGHDVPEPEHAMIAGDAVALSLTLDALDHPGAASPERMDPATCAQQEYPEFDADDFLSVDPARSARLADPVAAEPRLYCRNRPDCRNPRLRGYEVARPHFAVGRLPGDGPGRVAAPRVGPGRPGPSGRHGPGAPRTAQAELASPG